MKLNELTRILDSIIKCPYCKDIFSVSAGFGVKEHGYDMTKMGKTEYPNELICLLDEEEKKRLKVKMGE